MRLSSIILVGALIVLLAAPLAWRRESTRAVDGARRLTVISPHNEQIRIEIGGAFARWHQREFGEAAVIDWRTPGGTSDIRKLLEAQYTSAVSDGRIPVTGIGEPGSLPYDVLLGGGSYEHERLKRGVFVHFDGELIQMPISAPVAIPDETLRAWYGENRVGASSLYDPDRHWFGTTLSSFGILFNQPLFDELQLSSPQRWRDLCDPQLLGWVALADPRQSGSIATTYDAILNNYGWEDGWRTLRAMAANARYFSSSSTLPVLDVSAGEAAAGLCIDFYGRYQAQAVQAVDGDGTRLGFVEPAGETLIDPDPVSVLRGGPDPDLAMRFIDFLLSEEGQSVWQFAATGEGAKESEWGPRRFELRRLPIRRSMYSDHFGQFIDRVDPFAIASDVGQGEWRALIGPVLGACAIDIHDEQVHAWRVMREARRREASSSQLESMDTLFFAMPMHTLPDGTRVELSPESAPRIAADWADRERAAELRLDYMSQFRKNYADILKLAAAAAVQ